MEETTQYLTYEARIRQSPDYALRELSGHFDHHNAVWHTLRNVVRDLEAAGIPYMLVGALALNQHGYERATTDVDLIMTSEGLAHFRERYIGPGYRPAFEGALRSLRDTDTQVKIEVIIAGGFPGDGKPKPVSFPDPSEAVVLKNVRVVPFVKLIELKLASGLSAAHRLKDLADVQEMVHALNLPLDLGTQLEASVRGEYERLWHTVNDTHDDAHDPHDELRQSRRQT